MFSSRPLGKHAVFGSHHKLCHVSMASLPSPLQNSASPSLPTDVNLSLHVTSMCSSALRCRLLPEPQGHEPCGPRKECKQSLVVSNETFSGDDKCGSGRKLRQRLKLEKLQDNYTSLKTGGKHQLSHCLALCQLLWRGICRLKIKPTSCCLCCAVCFWWVVLKTDCIPNTS